MGLFGSGMHQGWFDPGRKSGKGRGWEQGSEMEPVGQRWAVSLLRPGLFPGGHSVVIYLFLLPRSPLACCCRCAWAAKELPIVPELITS